MIVNMKKPWWKLQCTWWIEIIWKLLRLWKNLLWWRNNNKFHCSQTNKHTNLSEGQQIAQTVYVREMSVTHAEHSVTAIFYSKIIILMPTIQNEEIIKSLSAGWGKTLITAILIIKQVLFASYVIFNRWIPITIVFASGLDVWRYYISYYN